jgi:hypothetical protein
MDPLLTLITGMATRKSMRWMLEAAGLGVSGMRGELHVKGAVAVWLWTLRAWEKDTTDDLSHTMAALDQALLRAEQAANSLCVGTKSADAAPDTPPGSTVDADYLPEDQPSDEPPAIEPESP